MCHYTDRKNRLDQQTFCCWVCGFGAHADRNAATNIASRWGDTELSACNSKKEIKALLLQRHRVWREQHGWP